MAISGEEAAASVPSADVRARPKAPAAEDSCFECNICLDGVREPVVTRCGHLFCWPCLYRWLNTNQTECPVCKAGVTATNVIPLYGRGADSIDPRTKPSGADGVPSRPEAERPRAEMRRPPNPFAGGPLGGGWGGFGGVGGIEGGVAGGQLHFQAGLGFFPSLFGLQFQSFTFPAAQTTSTSTGGERTSGDRTQDPRADGTSTSASSGGGSASAGGAGSAATEASQSQGRMITPEEVQQVFLSRLLLMLGSFVVICLVLF